MKIEFQRTDDEYYGVDELITPLVNVASQNEKYVGILCEILNVHNKYNEHIANDVKKTMDFFHFRLDKDNAAEVEGYRQLQELTYEFYWQIMNPDFEKQLRRFNQDLYNKKRFWFADKRFQQYRGLLLEKLVEAMVWHRFEKDKFECGCRIRINGCRIFFEYEDEEEWHRKETLDIAGWINRVRYGEFYECKVSPIRFKNEHYKYFMKLIAALDKNGAGNYIVGFVSADATAKLEMQKKLLEEDDISCKAEFRLIGREDLYGVKFYSIPEFA